MSWLSKNPYWQRFVAEVVRAAIAAVAGALAATQLVDIPADAPTPPAVEQGQ